MDTLQLYLPGLFSYFLVLSGLSLNLIIVGVKVISVCSINNMWDTNGLSVPRKGLHILFFPFPHGSLYLPESIEIALLCDSEWVFSSKACVYLWLRNKSDLKPFHPGYRIKIISPALVFFLYTVSVPRSMWKFSVKFFELQKNLKTYACCISSQLHDSKAGLCVFIYIF